MRVFDHPSKEKSMILYVTPKPKPDLFASAQRLIGKCIFVGWPHLFEAKVIAISNSTIKLTGTQVGATVHFLREDLKPADQAQWTVQRNSISEV